MIDNHFLNRLTEIHEELEFLDEEGCPNTTVALAKKAAVEIKQLRAQVNQLEKEVDFWWGKTQ